MGQKIILARDEKWLLNLAAHEQKKSGHPWK